MNYINSYFEDLNYIYINNSDIDSLKEKSLFITGASGLIGSTLADYLLFLNKTKDFKMNLYFGGRDKSRLTQRFNIYSEGTDYFFVPYDIQQTLNSDCNFDYIIHAASNADPMKIASEPVETIKANVIGLSNLFEYGKEHKLKRLLFVSSSEVYGKKDSVHPYLENDYGFIDVLNPRASYPLAKRCGENLCVSYSKEYGIDVCIVRPGHIYGPQAVLSDSRASAQFFRNVLSGKNIVLKSAGQQIRSYCYSLDCASAIISVLLKGNGCEAYNISNKESVCSILDFAKEVASQSQLKVIFTESSINEKQSYNLMDNSSLASGKLEAIGWKGLFDLKKGIKSTLECIN